ncbi:MAG: DUF808 domain-containing protein, partial [Kangiellaceae bacterium]|nr:DUF808 domain-containing protein [Kangiellaceae bacterium]
MQVAVVSTIALLMTVGVYGLVAGIVKLDDAGYYLIKEKAQSVWGSFKRALGKGLLSFAPFLMKLLSVAGTAAMFLVGGSILLHGIPPAEPIIHSIQEFITQLPAVGGFLSVVASMLVDAIFGIIAGAVVLVGVNFVSKFIPKKEGDAVDSPSR